MNVPEEIIYNFLIELKKKEVDPIGKAKLIREYCENKKLSIRGLAKELGMSHSTLADWVDYERIDKKEYKKLVDKGVNKKTIYKMLRETRGKTDTLQSVMEIEINLIIKETEIRLKSYVNNPIYDNKTIELIRDLRNILNRLELHIEKKQKG